MFISNGFRSFFIAFCSITLPLQLLSGGIVIAQNTSQWVNPPNSNDWLDATNWTNGVPNAAGDIAQVSGPLVGSTNPDLMAPATIGQLVFLGMGQAAISGVGPLTFDNPGNSPASISTEPSPIQAVVDVPISIAPGEQLRLDVASSSSLTLSDSIISTSGDIAKYGNGPLILSGASPTWGGSLTVNQGRLEVTSLHALQNSLNVQVEHGSEMVIVALEGGGQSGSYIVPNITLNGGLIRTNLGRRRNSLSVIANTHLLSDSVIQVTTDDILTLTGEISGTGGLSIYKRIDPAVNQSTIDFTFLRIDGPTSYSGATYIGPDMRVAFLHPQALGDSTSGTLVDRATLELHEGGGNEQIVVEHGNLALVESNVAYSHNITLNRGHLFGGNADGVSSRVATPIHFTEGIEIGTLSSGGNIVLEQGIDGSGTVVARNLIEIAGESTVHGDFLAIGGRDATSLTGEIDIAGDVFLVGATLEIMGNEGLTSNTFHVLPGINPFTTLQINETSTINSLVFDPRRAQRLSYIERHNLDVRVAENAVLTISDEFLFLGGEIQGAIAGQTTLIKKDRTPGLLNNIAGSEFEQILVEGGALTIRGNVGATPPEIHLGAHDTARIILDSTGVYTGDIFLHNARGHNRIGALSVSEGVTLAGNIYLGDQGSTLTSFFDWDATEFPVITGVIHGGDLSFVGNDATRILSGDHLYTGVTNVFGGEVRLLGNGRLNSTSAIIGSQGRSSTSGRSTLVLDNESDSVLSDRIPDTTPVFLNGMKILLIGHDGEPVSETLGTVHVSSGVSLLEVQNATTPNSETTLVIETLNRTQGGTVFFNTNNANATIRFAQAPILQNNLIGGWALVQGGSYPSDQNFATYGPNGIVPYSDIYRYATDIATATATDNVSLLNQNVVLSDDTDITINALKIRNSTLDLNGHTLTIESGGLLFRDKYLDTIRGGQLTAGTTDGAELLVSGVGRIEANIFDNPFGAVGLVFSSETEPSRQLILSGNNTYTGPTIINSGQSRATIRIMNESALPSGGDLILNGGSLEVAYESQEPIVLGNIKLNGYASISRITSNPPPLQPESVLIESGSIGLPIVGDAPIIKMGLGEATLGDIINHTGTILIEEGTLKIAEFGIQPFDDDHAITVQNNATLRWENGAVFSGRKLRLDGGVMDIELRGGVSAPIEVLPGGGTVRNERGETVITSTLTGSGIFTVEGGFQNGIIAFNARLSSFDGSLVFTGGNISIRRNNSAYNGSIAVKASNLNVSGSSALGNGVTTVFPEGRLNIVKTVRGNVVLSGGSLGFVPDGFLNSPRFLGELVVTDDSSILIKPIFQDRQIFPLIAGEIRFLDNTNLTVSQDLTVDVTSSSTEHLVFSGNIFVQGNTTLTSFDVITRLSGTIQPESETATLNLVGNNTFELLSNIRLENGRSLALTFDGQSEVLSLTGLYRKVFGNGTYIGDISLSGGASITPGNNSAGALAINGNTTFGDESRFLVDLGGALQGDEYDTLNITGEATLGGLIEVSNLNDFVPALGDEFTVMTWLEGQQGAFDEFVVDTFFLARGIGFEMELINPTGNGSLVLHTVAAEYADFDGNGTVDADDFSLWQANFGTNATHAQGDADFDGDIDGADFLAWQTGYGQPAAGVHSATGVPEPATSLLLLVSAIVLLFCKLKQNRFCKANMR